VAQFKITDSNSDSGLQYGTIYKYNDNPDLGDLYLVGQLSKDITKGNTYYIRVGGVQNTRYIIND
jgi:hypothetical protein